VSGLPLHLAALAIGLVLVGATLGLVYFVVESGGRVIFCAILGVAAAYCFGRAALLLLGWEQ
jgi:hypothetical protein